MSDAGCLGLSEQVALACGKGPGVLKVLVQHAGKVVAEFIVVKFNKAEALLVEWVVGG